MEIKEVCISKQNEGKRKIKELKGNREKEIKKQINRMTEDIIYKNIKNKFSDKQKSENIWQKKTKFKQRQESGNIIENRRLSEKEKVRTKVK